MSISKLGHIPGQCLSLVTDCDYLQDPLMAYYTLCGKKHNNLLLESAEIENKNSVNSLILVDAAVKLTCRNQTVVCEALTENGIGVLQVIQDNLTGSQCSMTTADDNRSLTVEIPNSDSQLDEDSRLKSLSVFDVLRIVQQQIKTIDDHPHALFVAGAFAYDLLATFESMPDVPNGHNDCPDYVFYVAETLLLIDHQKQNCQMLASVFSGEEVAHQFFRLNQRMEEIKQQLESLTPLPMTNQRLSQSDVTVSKSDNEYCEDVVRLKQNILAGDIFQVVPSRTFSLPCESPHQSYRVLKKNNPSPYMFYIQDEAFQMFGASPESALKYEHTSNQVEVYPIAGTRPRGKWADGRINPDLDSRIELTLREDTKEKAEHLMLVDLARNDIARVAKPGSRYVKNLLKVDRYSHVMHLVSRVVGQLREDLDCLHAYQACMNMGTLVGAPKVSAASLLRQIEGERRGSYGGAVGYINGQGDMDTCIVIRSAFVKNKMAYVQAGAGVVYDSVPQSEADETRGKAQAVLSAIIAAHSESAKEEKANA